MKSLLALSLAATAVTLIAVVSASAGSNHAMAGGVGAITNPPPALTTPPATKPKFITIRVWSGAYQQAFAKSAGAAFTKATGVKIHWDTTDEFVSYQRMDQEIRAGKRPDADASMQAQQRAYLDAVRGLTLPISPKVAPNALKANRAVAAPQGTSPSAKSWAYMNPYTVTIGFIVRKDKVNPADLQKWSDLANPKFAHSIVFDQIYSTTAFALGKSMGVDPAKNPPSSLDPVWQRIKSLRPNLASLGNGADVTTALTNGNATIGVTCTCNALSAIASGTPLVMIPPRDGGYEVADAYYIHKNIPAANYYYAELFANYLYSNATQAYLAKDQALVPTVASAPIPAYMKKQPLLFPRTAAQVKAAKMVIAPIPLMARYDAQWQTSFEAAIK